MQISLRLHNQRCDYSIFQDKSFDNYRMLFPIDTQLPKLGEP